jgi:hypothetical protein
MCHALKHITRGHREEGEDTKLSSKKCRTYWDPKSKALAF